MIGKLSPWLSGNTMLVLRLSDRSSRVVPGLGPFSMEVACSPFVCVLGFSPDSPASS